MSNRELLSIATSALRVTQKALDTTGHNIANVNTEGYHRQRVDTATRTPLFTGAGFFGTGVHITDVQRAYDEFLDNRVREATTRFSETDRFYRLSAQVDNITADPDVGLASAMANFFNAVHDVATDPTSIPARQTLLSEAGTLTDRFHLLDSRLRELDAQTQHELQAQIDEINTTATKIAELNHKIVHEIGKGQGHLPNDLLDQRDLLVTRLAEKIDVTPVPQDDGSVSLFIGKGHELVGGAHANRLGLKANDLDPNQQEITFDSDSTSLTVTKDLTGGEVGGLLRFREQVLIPTQNKLGRLAAGIALEFNQLHQSGYDLDGNTGQDFFVAPPIAVMQNGTGTVTATYTGPSADLQASDYLLEYDGSSYTLTRLSDRFQQTLTTFPATVDGIQIDVTSAPTGASRFLIRPTAEAAGKIEPNLDDPRRIAAAGSAGAEGDNQIALSLAALESDKKLLGGKATFQDAYGQMVTEVGSLTRAAEISRGAHETVKRQTLEAHEQLAGVNLDEEAANLVKYQQTYQAAAQVVTIASQTFDALINAVRR
ncbi:flagellar hook-associated protein 1 FlgK [Methylomarinovum caldicuralii]|uniref:Flagellar hook-associated protein 1 n=1 Tax=Methylomarinovum caldicuralii TaxID=438856 RepID=A0AAU9C6U8_9GAMM|nr:flagellar hook-associated protein FlgK [Methylomarinovum caldicuralii]BCX82929.1 flagellar hook-associated protein 1 FlgK [Methylomarinovum caldicuralii]